MNIEIKRALKGKRGKLTQVETRLLNPILERPLHVERLPAARVEINAPDVEQTELAALVGAPRKNLVHAHLATTNQPEMARGHR